MTVPLPLANENQAIDGLTIAAIIYLALPNLIYILGWFQLSFALPLCACLLYLLYSVFTVNTISHRLELKPSAAMLIIVTAFAWAAFGGGSHFMYANHDWVIRDAVLGDLIRSNWPVIYETNDGGQLILRSAIGYFLPPALFGKLFGTNHIDIVIYLWTAAGVLTFLVLLPLPKSLGWPLCIGLIVTVFFSGMDFLGVLIATQSTPIFPLRLEWWVPLSYPSLTGQLLWAPNHCLPIWISTLLIFRHRNERALLPVSLAALPLTLIWTPFAAPGLAPFVGVGLWRLFQRLSWKIIPWRSIVVSIIFSLPICMVLTLDISNISSSAMASPPTGTAYKTISIQTYLIFVSFEFLLLALALTTHVKQVRDFFIVSILMLLALPLLRFGPSNDLLIRLSSPPIVILLAICIQALLPPKKTRHFPTLWMTWIFLAIGAHTAFNELWRSATFRYWKADYSKSLSELEGGQPAPHYVGRLNSPRLKQLLRSN